MKTVKIRITKLNLGMGFAMIRRWGAYENPRKYVVKQVGKKYLFSLCDKTQFIATENLEMNVNAKADKQGWVKATAIAQ